MFETNGSIKIILSLTHSLFEEGWKIYFTCVQWHSADAPALRCISGSVLECSPDTRTTTVRPPSANPPYAGDQWLSNATETRVEQDKLSGQCFMMCTALET
ncbi:hypothetical protein DICVIV_12890, partial [Dictyocaulus viviparus]